MVGWLEPFGNHNVTFWDVRPSLSLVQTRLKVKPDSSYVLDEAPPAQSLAFADIFPRVFFLHSFLDKDDLKF